MELYKRRENLHGRYFHIGDDLTRRQRQTLKKLADRYGYYYKGELCFTEPSHGIRVELKAFRKSQRRINETPEEGMPSASYSQWPDVISDKHMDVSYTPGHPMR